MFADIRAEVHTLCDGRHLVISPDLMADFRSLPFADSTFPVVVFDPPHLDRVGQSVWMGKKYGQLNKKTWRSDLRAGFKEEFRVAKAMMGNIEKVVSFVWKVTCVVFGIPLLLVALDASLCAMESNFSVWRVIGTVLVVGGLLWLRRHIESGKEVRGK